MYLYTSEVKKLIDLVKDRRPIYDSDDKLYRQNVDDLWMQIAEEIGIEVNECKRKWLSLRNSYARYLRETRTSDLRGKKRKQWYMADAMSFVKDYVNLQPINFSTIYSANVVDESQSSPSNSSTSSGKNSPEPSKKSRFSATEKEEEVEEELIMKVEPDAVYMPSGTREDMQSENSRLYEGEMEAEMQEEEFQLAEYENPRTKLKANNSTTTEKRYESRTWYKKSRIRKRVPSKRTTREEEALPENGNTLFFKSLLIDYENLSNRRQRRFRMYMLEKMNELQENEENE
ncbi:uncharacterized protein [Eurosta solidaginis]|uniref:uncharacterized protein isoform X2 n=1 Tax=Eurosta solidaginis TaxID=178769 RepID=UPI003530F020